MQRFITWDTIEARVDSFQIMYRLQQQPGANHDDDCKCGFGNDEHAANVTAACSG